MSCHMHPHLICDVTSLVIITFGLPSSDTTPSVPVTANAPLNRMGHPARLGLARAMSRDTEDYKESEMLYNDVITMAPQVRHNKHVVFS